MAQPRGGHRAHRLPDGRVLMLGGHSQRGGRGLEVVEIFDPATDRFRELAPLPHPAGAFELMAIGDDHLLLWHRQWELPRGEPPTPLMVYDLPRLRARSLSPPGPALAIHAAADLGGGRVGLAGVYRTDDRAQIPREAAVVLNAPEGRFGSVRDLGPSRGFLHILAEERSASFWVLRQFWQLAVELRRVDGQPLREVPLAQAPRPPIPPPSPPGPYRQFGAGEAVPLPDGRVLYFNDGRRPMVWTPDAIRLRAPCAGLAASFETSAPGFFAHQDISPECRDAVRRGVDRSLDPLLKPFADQLVLPGPSDEARQTRDAWSALCQLAPPWSVRFLARQARGTVEPSTCFVSLVQLDTGESRELVRDHVADRGLVGHGDGLSVAGEMLSTLTQAPQLRASLGPLLDRARTGRAWGVDQLYQAICPARADDPADLRQACAAAAGQPLADLPLGPVRRERLEHLGLNFAIGAVAIGAGVAGKDMIVGRVAATTSAAVAGAYWGATSDGGDWGQGVGLVLTGALGFIGGGAAGFLFSHSPGAPRVAVTVASVAPLLFISVINTHRNWDQRSTW